jgi:hypothetical protein
MKLLYEVRDFVIIQRRIKNIPASKKILGGANHDALGRGVQLDGK